MSAWQLWDSQNQKHTLLNPSVNVWLCRTEWHVLALVHTPFPVCSRLQLPVNGLLCYIELQAFM